MKPQFLHDLYTSFYLWFEHRLTHTGEAYFTGCEQTFTLQDSDDAPSNYNTLYSHQGQFVFSGTGVPSGVYMNGIFVPQNDDSSTGLLIDFEKGRILLGTGLNEDAAITGYFDQREINIYTTQDDEDAILLGREFIISGDPHSKVHKNPKADSHSHADSSHVTDPHVECAYIPAAFITLSNSKNEAWALGGEKSTSAIIRVVFVVDDSFLLDGAMSLFSDAVHRNFNIYSSEDSPIGEFNSLKEPPYYYPTFAKTPIGTCYIKEVSTSKLKDQVRVNISLPKSIKVGFVDFTLEVGARLT